MKKEWVLYKNSQENNKILEGLKEENPNIPESIIEVLFNRGFDTTEKINNHLYSGIKELKDTSLMKDSDKFVDIICEIIKEGGLIVNYSDFDIDGIGSSAIFVNAIRNIGGKVEFYTNNRFVDGFGIVPNGVNELYKKYPDVKLIVTTDNGIVGFDGVKRAKELGIKVIITDHHKPDVKGKVPEADAIINPHQKDCKYPFKKLCGAGVIFKLLLLLYNKLNADKNYLYGLMDILALSTVGDMVSLVDENRIFVKEGLKLLNSKNNTVIREILNRLNVTEADEETIGYILSPTFNALSRMDGEASLGIEILTGNASYDKIDYLIEKNSERKELTNNQLDKAKELLKNENKNINSLVIHDDEFHEGVIGLVAGRLKEKYNKPTIIFSTVKNNKGDIFYKGSGRSIEGYDLLEGLTRISKYIQNFGGHDMAGGLSIKASDFENFKKAFEEDVSINADMSLLKTKKVFIDTVISENDINQSIIDGYKQLKPFGVGFEKPKFGLKCFNVDIEKSSNRDGIFYPYIGKGCKHLKLVNKKNIVLLAFNESKLYKNMNEPLHIKAVGFPSLNIYNNYKTYQFIVENDYLQKVK